MEGEPFAIAGGLLAHRRVAPLWLAMAAAIGGAFLIDQGWFWLGRRFRTHRCVQAMTRRPAFARALALIEAHPSGFILLFRFAYGVRAVAPLAIGTSRVPALRFVLLSALAAILWGSAFTLLGYELGQALAPWLPTLMPILLVAGAALIVAPWVMWRRSRPREAA